MELYELLQEDRFADLEAIRDGSDAIEKARGMIKRTMEILKGCISENHTAQNPLTVYMGTLAYYGKVHRVRAEFTRDRQVFIDTIVNRPDSDNTIHPDSIKLEYVMTIFAHLPTLIEEVEKKDPDVKARLQLLRDTARLIKKLTAESDEASRP